MFKINQFECSFRKPIFNISTLIFALEYTIIPVCLHIFKSDGIIRSHLWQTSLMKLSDISSSLDNACSFVLLFWGRAIGLSETVLQCSQAKKWFQAKLCCKWRKHEKSFNSLGTEKQNKTKKPCNCFISLSSHLKFKTASLLGSSLNLSYTVYSLLYTGSQCYFCGTDKGGVMFEL